MTVSEVKEASFIKQELYVLDEETVFVESESNVQRVREDSIASP